MVVSSLGTEISKRTSCTYGNLARKIRRKKGVMFTDDGAPDDFYLDNPYKDPVVMLEMREHLVMEKWIDIEKANVLREKVKWCYRVEGVNHLQEWRHLVHQNLEATRGVGWEKGRRPHSLHGPKVEEAIKWRIEEPSDGLSE